MSNPDFFARNGIIAVGDSFTAANNSWIRKIIPRYPEVPVMVDAQSGRSISNYGVPHDLNGNTDYGYVLYFIGTADLIFDSNNLDHVTRQLGRHLAEYKALEYTPILLLSPGCHTMVQTSVRFRTAYEQAAIAADCYVLDMASVWDSDRLFDGLHPDDSLQQDIADFVESALIDLNVLPTT